MFEKLLPKDRPLNFLKGKKKEGQRKKIFCFKLWNSFIERSHSTGASSTWSLSSFILGLKLRTDLRLPCCSEFSFLPFSLFSSLPSLPLSFPSLFFLLSFVSYVLGAKELLCPAASWAALRSQTVHSVSCLLRYSMGLDHSHFIMWPWFSTLHQLKFPIAM